MCMTPCRMHTKWRTMRRTNTGLLASCVSTLTQKSLSPNLNRLNHLRKRSKSTPRLNTSRVPARSLTWPSQFRRRNIPAVLQPQHEDPDLAGVSRRVPEECCRPDAIERFQLKIPVRGVVSDWLEARRGTQTQAAVQQSWRYLSPTISRRSANESATRSL